MVLDSTNARGAGGARRGASLLLVAGVVALATGGCGGGAAAAAPDAATDGAAETCFRDRDCDDGNPCTEDLCAAGTCAHTTAADGESCDDGLACTTGDACEGGACVGVPIDCGALGDFCNTGVCTEAAGGCTTRPAVDGTPCDDGQYCTVGDACHAGQCAGTPRDCAALDGPCVVGTCTESPSQCSAVPVADDTPCDDGALCTVGDRCLGGTCTPTGLNPCDDGDICTDDTCNLGRDECAHAPHGPIPGGEGPPGDATCSDGIDNDCDGLTDLADASCTGCVVPGDCDDGNPCTGEVCTLGLCDNPLLTGTGCTTGQYCRVGGVCHAGQCVESDRDCNDSDACTADSCDETANQCHYNTLAIDLASPVATSSRDGTPLTACVAAGGGGRVLVWVDLRNQVGAPVLGATVTIGGSAATAAAARPGIYYREVDAPASPGTTNLAVAVQACGQNVTLTSQATLTAVAGNATAGGTGGCAPVDGNLRVTVVTAETGAPLAGAAVLVGGAEGTPFEHAAEAGFGGTGAAASNVALTDGSGRAVFYDYGAALAGPVTVTAGAADRSYFTIASGNASDVVLPLRLLHPPAVPSTTYSGTGTASITGCDDIDLGMVLPKLSLDVFSAFDLTALLMKNKCWDPQSGQVPPTPIPANVWIPQQDVGFLCLGDTLQESRWSIDLKNTAATGQTENLGLVLAYAPYTDVQTALSGGGMAALFALLNFRRAGWVLDENVPRGSPNSLNITANETYANSYTVTYSGKPTETDVTGITLGDYAGQNGTGPLMLLGTKAHPYDQSGSTVAIPNSDLTPAPPAPAGVRRLASVVASYLDPTAHPSIPANRRDGISTVLVRDDGGGNAPFGSSGGTGTVSSFLGLAGTTFTAPATFTWENATANGNAPLYSVHELAVRTHQYLPVLTACATENEIRDQRSTQWVVVRPFAASCSGQECFTLPTLPASFPRQSPGTNKKSGFEQLVGSGVACGGPGASCAVAGESCVDPDDAGAAGFMCMGGAGTDADPYATRDYYWWLHLYDLGLASTFDFNAFAFADRVKYLTHESSNEAVFQ